MNTSIGIKETSFGPLLTPARDVRKKSKVLKTFQLTIKNRLGAALKFANGCDNNLALGAEAIKITEGVDSEYISCPLCCRQKLPSAQFANMIPSDQDESACAHYMFCCRPSTSHQLHWHTQHCCKSHSYVYPYTLYKYRMSTVVIIYSAFCFVF